jgi:bacterioferritin-associated ferredoxin
MIRHTVGQKQNQPQLQASSSPARSSAAVPTASHAVHPLLHLQRTVGNQTVQRLLCASTEDPQDGANASATSHFAQDLSHLPMQGKTSGRIQTKLTVSSPRDRYEQEADHIAAQAMRTPAPQLQTACPCGSGCHRCRKAQAENKHLRTERLHSDSADGIVAPPIIHEALRSASQPLDSVTRSFMEASFGDVSQILSDDVERLEEVGIRRPGHRTVGLVSGPACPLP